MSGSKEFLKTILHFAGWLIFFSLPFLLFPGTESKDRYLHVVQSPNYWLFHLFFIFLFYFNANFLIPRFYLNKKYSLYFGCILILFCVVFFMHQPGHPKDEHVAVFKDPHPPFDPAFPPFKTVPQDDSRSFKPGHKEPPKVDLIALFLFVTVWAFSTSLKLTKQWAATEQRVVQAEADKANAELSFLKAQINPHFLFNTLNNIYALAVKKNDNTADSIMKLSNIMRYVTDDVNNDFVSLENELNCITDYIDLQRLRLNKKAIVTFSVEGEVKGKKISPLILLTFIENVFKYGISNHEVCYIRIVIKIEEHAILFFCQNKLFATLKKAERTGIGIANTRKRLEHLYPGKHNLTITTEDELYTVNLVLQL